MHITPAAMHAQLVLRVASFCNQPPATPLLAVFSAQGGTIGRAPDNELVLDDPGKYISRSHANVTGHEGMFYLTDTGSNPSIVNDMPLGPGAGIALENGDRIVIGDYVLEAEVVAPLAVASADDATMMLPTPVSAPAPDPAAMLPLFEPPPFMPAAALPVFEPLLGQAAAPSVFDDGPRDMLAQARILDSVQVSPGGEMLADPLGLGMFGNMAADAPALAPARAAEQDHASPELQAFAAPPAAFMSIPADYDPLADLHTAVQDGVRPERAPVAVTATPARPPVAVPVPVPAPVQVQVQKAPAPAAPAAQDSAVLAALLRGLGVPALHSTLPPEQLACLVGEMLRAATAGTMDVLMARALTKRESHIDMTMIAPRANNPLKFFPDADSALTQMLSAQIPGYMPPLSAIAGAFDDLKAHELAVIAGMRAALAAVVQRFDPSRIEQRLSAPARFDKLMPASRKARMWDRLVELYGDLARDADDALQRLFGEKFSAAYEQQVERLRGERVPANAHEPR